MKRFLSLILCLVFVVCALVSCGDEVVEPIPEHYPEIQDKTIDRTVDLYMIVGEDTPKTVYDSVARMIYAYVLKTYDIELNVKFEYDNTVKKDESGNLVSCFNKGITTLTAGGTKSAILLVNDYEFMDALDSASDDPEVNFKLLDLSGYLTTTKFGKLNKDLPDALIDAVTVEKQEFVLNEKDEKVLDEAGKPVTKPVNKIFAMPNNRVLGEYEYLVINKAVARDMCLYSPEILKSYVTYEQTAELRARMAELGYTQAEIDEYVRPVSGAYSDRFVYEAQGNYCNIVSVPEITREDALESAFVAVDTGNDKLNEKAMQIIYALNYDAELRNLLQYGVKNTNYTIEEREVVDKNGETVTVEYIKLEGGENTYRMNPYYTGNMFIMAYCEELDEFDAGELPAIVWTYETMLSGIEQNKDVVLADD